jgi:hypothetical protein
MIINRNVMTLSVLLMVGLAGCTSAPPQNPDNICETFEEKGGWYKDARKSSRRWGTSIPVMMSFIYQESAFKARARPPRTKILWIIPGPRPASAYGYSQATNETWASYQKSTGSWGADRNDFDDAIDFIGWYNDQSNRRNKIAKNDAYNQYLAYHEGQGGFAKNSFTKKKWLKDVARKVSDRADKYVQQLNSCEKKLNRGWFGRLFS